MCWRWTWNCWLSPECPASAYLLWWHNLLNIWCPDLKELCPGQKPIGHCSGEACDVQSERDGGHLVSAGHCGCVQVSFWLRSSSVAYNPSLSQLFPLPSHFSPLSVSSCLSIIFWKVASWHFRARVHRAVSWPPWTPSLGWIPPPDAIHCHVLVHKVFYKTDITCFFI